MTAQSPTPEAPLRIGTRGSELALAQARETSARLVEAHGLAPEAIKIEVIRTTGDRVQDRPLSEIGGKGLFTKEIETALLDGRIDIAVHSMKDVATVAPDGLVIPVFLPREDVRDAFISPSAGDVPDLPQGAVVGSSSLRRQAQLLNRRPDLKVVMFRGNVGTRLQKVADGQVAATFLACAGLNRLGLGDRITRAMPTGEMPPAIAQGAIGIEIRKDDEAALTMIQPLNDPTTEVCVRAERRFLHGLDGSCRTPIAGLAVLNGDRVLFEGEVLRPDGSERLATTREGSASDAEAMCADAAAELRKRAGPGFFDEV